ncbi:hypothetical protein HUN03_00603 [Mycoplasmopsis anatis]|nr:hypothetical protein [Mycoplasmopsis anatis]MBW0595343.1 hypothetical protein [Mycoplasmopsis anatis]MBW0596286.1 hypothetical protein [Mycoplasmopsis anatis]MBW0596464.1 hypothetical protein [Mycoplasmopsis anatis]MBW0597785.1 hypothetical protein [Mycoplasmopsis anatis]
MMTSLFILEKNMKFSKRKLVYILSFLGIGLMAAGSFYIYTSKFKKQNAVEEINKNNDLGEIQELSVFPNISDSYYQEFLIKNDFGNSKIDDKLVVVFIKDILKRMSVSYGEISFKSEITDTKIIITLQWQYKEKFEVKKYTFQIKSI